MNKVENNNYKAKNIEVMPYNDQWPIFFQRCEKEIKEYLTDNIIEIHHIGSTSVEGLSAKNVIDILCVVKDLDKAKHQLAETDYKYKGEYNIPFRFYFSNSKNSEFKVHVHVCKEKLGNLRNGFIDLNLKFRDYLRNNISARNEYAKLKNDILEDPNARKQEKGKFSNYNLRKNTFIKEILDKANFDGYLFNFCTHELEWQEYHRIRKEQIFDVINREYKKDLSVVNEPNRYYFCFYKGTKIIAISQIHIMNDKDYAIIRAVVVDKPYQKQNIGANMMGLLEEWLKQNNIQKSFLHALMSAVEFYKKLNYKEMSFKDPKRIITQNTVEMVDMGKIIE